MSKVYKVGEISDILDRMISNIYDLKSIYIEGEISNVVYQKSGHLYFSLKDDNSIIKCAAFSYRYKNIPDNLVEGMKVEVLASINYYKPQGSITFYVEKLKKADKLGQLYKQLELRREEYRKKGYFSDEIKKNIPYLVKRVGVVTAPTGAAIQDIIKTIHNRDKYVDIFLYPVKVQGEGAKEEISEAIKYFNENNDKYNLDALIVGRGGGSIEDLWAFNEVEVIEAIYNSKIFVVSAVGHESDTLLSDYVADLRASTPTQAAEKLIKNYDENIKELNNFKNRLYLLLNNKYSIKKNELSNFSNSYVLKNFSNKFNTLRMMNSDLENRANIALENKRNNKIIELNLLKDRVSLNKIMDKLEKENKNIINLSEKLDNNMFDVLKNKKIELEKLTLSLSKHSIDDILEKGFSITKLNGKVITSNMNVKTGDELETILYNKKIESVVK
ncbi:MAG: exodeoxyribonuclease VII large subunit [Streptobacillus sp.]